MGEATEWIARKAGVDRLARFYADDVWEVRFALGGLVEKHLGVPFRGKWVSVLVEIE